MTIIQDGWAVASITLPDGRRQIVSFLLSGDIVSPENLYDATSEYRVESVGEVTSYSYDRTAFKEALHRSSDLFEAYIKAWAVRTNDLNQLALDLGRGRAEERISRLLLNLMERLTKLGQANGREMPFPLRRHHIADATGLTSVYVSKILGEFNSAKLISLGERSLTIPDPTRLHRMAAWPRAGRHD